VTPLHIITSPSSEMGGSGECGAVRDGGAREPHVSALGSGDHDQGVVTGSQKLGARHGIMHRLRDPQLLPISRRNSGSAVIVEVESWIRDRDRSDEPFSVTNVCEVLDMESKLPPPRPARLA